jgi:uncharacterized protein YodC (DUF2158 family)
MNDNEIYFMPGDEVILRQVYAKSPVMVVQSVDKVSKDNERPQLLGITCFWFDLQNRLQRNRFNSKDLKPYVND